MLTSRSTDQEKSIGADNVSSVLAATTLKLLRYCESHDWAGADPYDALNSRVFKAMPLLDRRLPRLILTQMLKRMPFDVRPLLLVPPTQNPKALALFLTSQIKLSKVGLIDYRPPVIKLKDRLIALRSPNKTHWCWGYSFPWQTRTLVVPRGFPNLVCTTFVAEALLDAYEETGEGQYLEMAASGADFIRNELFWSDGDSVAGFTYPLPSIRNNVHNGNILGAALFCRVAKYTGNDKLVETALKVARYSASRQREDGSWLYGEHPTQGWIDNFHTGYNLCGLDSIGRSLGISEFDSNVRRGLTFYRNHFFLKDGACRYFHDCTYPIDIHCVAQSIITLVTLKDLQSDNLLLASSIFRWVMSHMWDDAGFFYYRVLRHGTIRTSYMRWSQAWMLLALTTLLPALSAES